MTNQSMSAIGFANLVPAPANALLTGQPGWDVYTLPDSTESSVTFGTTFRSLDCPIVEVLRSERLPVSGRPIPRVGIASSKAGRATDVDEDKGAAFGAL
jgi:hypothetical protein